MITQQDAARELLARRKARNSLIDFTTYTKEDFQVGEHHKEIADALQSVEDGSCDRLMVFAPPRHTKSELASRRFPAWYMGRHPERQLICATYSGDFALDFGREVRGIVDSTDYRNVFPEVTLAADSRAANRWHTTQGGISVYVGVGGPITGRGAHVAIIDDPFKNREEADSEVRREMVWKWYSSTLRTRLMPKGAIVLVLCMTGDTPVMLSDGTQRPLSDIRPGDTIATYSAGKLATSTVRNWANQGLDRVYEIRTNSGITVRANERHPFLVARDRDTEWVKLKNLKAGDKLLRTAITGASGVGSSARPMGASEMSGARASARLITTRLFGQAVIARLQSMWSRVARRVCATATGWITPHTSRCLRLRVAGAPSAICPQIQRSGNAARTNCASTTITPLARFAAFFATIATSLLAVGKQPKCSTVPLSTYEITLDEIVEIREAGREEVFDIQVDGTENFIANGLVSHNTRWHEDDLAGRLLEQNPDEWKVVSLPAVRNEGTSREKALWPEWYPLDDLKRIKADVLPRDWSALYQQQPSPDEGTYFQREWFQTWQMKPKFLSIYGTSDYAVTMDGGDWTVHRMWGVDSNGYLYRLGGWRGQTTSDVWIEQQLNLVDTFKPLAWFGESGVIQKAIEPMLRRRMMERNTYCRLEWMPSINDKPTRARGFQSRAAMQRVWFEPNADIDEFLKFPAGKHDDDVDCASLMGRALEEAHPAVIIVKPQDQYIDRYDRLFNQERDLGSQDWKTA